ncbi:hypothetical protein Tco_1037725 [Tanacetum coccineum]
MSTQQDIYAASSENRPPMLNKENYVPWSSCILCYVKSRPNRKLIYNSIMNGPYVRRMIPEPGDADRKFPVKKPFMSNKHHVAVDSCDTVQEIGYVFNKMMKKVPTLCNSREKLSCLMKGIGLLPLRGIEVSLSYHHLLKVENDFKETNTSKKDC